MFNKFNNRPNKNYNQNNLLDQSLPSYKNPELERLILEIKYDKMLFDKCNISIYQTIKPYLK